MKIIRLKSENVMRLIAVDITPTGDMVIVGGKNGAGKSSVLNSIAMALGGAAMCPQEPIRAGETEAKIVVELDDLIVTRRFSRSVIDVRTQDDTPESYAAKPKVFTDTTSTLVVTNKDGARYPSPQAMLDKLLGKLTFDPLAFTRMEPKAQDDALRKLVGLDVSKFEDQRKEAFQHRALLKQSHAIKVAQLAAMPHHAGVHDEIPMADISAEMLKMETLRIISAKAGRDVEKIQHQIDVYVIEEKALALSIKKLEDQLILERKKHAVLVDGRLNSEQHLVALKAAHEAALTAVPDADVIRKRLTDAEVNNKRVQENATYAQRTTEADVVAEQVAEQDALVTQAVDAKRAALESATFPVEGLGLCDGGVTFGGLPFSQASSSEQLRVSVAIGIALNPKLKVLLIRSGNLLDDDSLKAVAAQAEAADVQCWVEYVTTNAEGVSVMIEDGKVAE